MPRGQKAGREESRSRRLYTPIRPFGVLGTNQVMNPGTLVEDSHPMFKRFPDKFRELQPDEQVGT